MTLTRPDETNDWVDPNDGPEWTTAWNVGQVCVNGCCLNGLALVAVAQQDEAGVDLQINPRFGSPEDSLLQAQFGPIQRLTPDQAGELGQALIEASNGARVVEAANEAERQEAIERLRELFSQPLGG